MSLKQSLQAPGNKKMYFVLEVDRGFTELETRCSLIQSFEIYLRNIYDVSVPGDSAGGFGDWSLHLNQRRVIVNKYLNEIHCISLW